MTKLDLEHKAKCLTEALSGTESKLDTVHIRIDDKEEFKKLHKELGEPQMFEPTKTTQDYFFAVLVDKTYFFINYRPKSITTYETL